MKQRRKPKGKTSRRDIKLNYPRPAPTVPAAAPGGGPPRGLWHKLATFTAIMGLTVDLLVAILSGQMTAIAVAIPAILALIGSLLQA